MEPAGEHCLMVLHIPRAKSVRSGLSIMDIRTQKIVPFSFMTGFSPHVALNCGSNPTTDDAAAGARTDYSIFDLL